MAKADRPGLLDTPAGRGGAATGENGRRRRRVADVTSGDHLCCVFDSDAERKAAIVPYLLMGLERGEKVLYIVDARTTEAVLGDLREAGVDVALLMARGRLAVMTRDDMYVRGGAVEPAVMIDMLRTATDLAVAEGYGALRVTGEMSWALRGIPGSERLNEYEARLSEILPGGRCTVLCQYDRRLFDPTVLLDALRTHPHVAVGSAVVSNPYAVPAVEHPGEHGPAANLDRRMRHLAGQRREERALDLAEERIEAIFAGMRDGLSVLDSAGIHMAVNPALCELTGFSAEELVGVGPPHPYWPPEEAATIGAALAAAEAGAGGEFALTFMRKSGERFPVHVTPSLIRDEEGRTVVCFATVRDDTERARAVREMREREETFRLTFDAGPFPAAIVGFDRDFQRVNEALARFTGYTSEELEALGFDQVTHPDEKETDAAGVQRLVSGEADRYERDKRYVRKDGSVAWGHLVVRLLHDTDGRPFAFLAMIDDITERAHAEEALRESEGRYRSLFENMHAGLAHCRMEWDAGRPVDWTYLAVNGAFAARTGLRDATGRRVSELIPGLDRDNPELFEIYGRVAAGGPPEWFETYLPALGDWLEVNVFSPAPSEFIAIFDVITERKRAETARRHAGDDLAEAQRIAHVGSWSWDPVVGVLTWSDELYRIFGLEPGTTAPSFAEQQRMYTDETRGAQLAAVERALTTGEEFEVPLDVVRPDGAIRHVVSRGRADRGPDGSTVRLRGTVTDDTERHEADEPVPAGGAAGVPDVAPDASGMATILVVEDDPGVRRLTERILSGAGYAVLVAPDGTAALEALAAHPGRVGLVVTDLSMPTMGGEELARRMAAAHPGTRILLTSGFPGAVATTDGIVPPGTHLLGKPFTAAELTAKVREVLGSRE